MVCTDLFVLGIASLSNNSNFSKLNVLMAYRKLCEVILNLFFSL